jgi:hypothetical protein
MLRDKQHGFATVAGGEAVQSGQKAKNVGSTRDDTVIEGTAKEVVVAEPEQGPDDQRSAGAEQTKQADEASAASAPSASKLNEKDTSEDSAGPHGHARDGAAASSENASNATMAASDGDRASSILVPPRAPDDPGVTPDTEDDSEVSLQRFRSAHIR